MRHQGRGRGRGRGEVSEVGEQVQAGVETFLERAVMADPHGLVAIAEPVMAQVWAGVAREDSQLDRAAIGLG